MNTQVFPPANCSSNTSPAPPAPSFEDDTSSPGSVAGSTSVSRSPRTRASIAFETEISPVNTDRASAPVSSRSADHLSMRWANSENSRSTVNAPRARTRRRLKSSPNIFAVSTGMSWAALRRAMADLYATPNRSFVFCESGSSFDTSTNAFKSRRYLSHAANSVFAFGYDSSNLALREASRCNSPSTVPSMLRRTASATEAFALSNVFPAFSSSRSMALRMSFATIIRPPPDGIPSRRTDSTAAFIRAMSARIPASSASSSPAPGFAANASMRAASGLSDSANAPAAPLPSSTSAVPCIASAWRGSSSSAVALRMATTFGSAASPWAAAWSANSFIRHASDWISVARRSQPWRRSISRSSNPSGAFSAWPTRRPICASTSERSFCARIAASHALPAPFDAFSTMRPSTNLNASPSCFPVNFPSALKVFCACSWHFIRSFASASESRFAPRRSFLRASAVFFPTPFVDAFAACSSSTSSCATSDFASGRFGAASCAFSASAPGFCGGRPADCTASVDGIPFRK